MSVEQHVQGEATVFGDGFERVLAAARHGEEHAWTRLYLDLAPVLTGYLIGQGCRNAEDITAETMLQVVRDLERFDGGETSFRSWVFTIAHHRLIDDRRRATARPADPTEDEHLDRHASIYSCEDHALSNLGPPELEHLLCATTQAQRDVLLLRYVADLSLHETAEVLGKEYNAVKALHRRALTALRMYVAGDTYPVRGARALAR